MKREAINDLSMYCDAVLGVAEILSQPDLDNARAVADTLCRISLGQIDMDTPIGQFAYFGAQEIFKGLTPGTQRIILEACSKSPEEDGYGSTLALVELQRILVEYPDVEKFDSSFFEEVSFPEDL